VRLGQRGDDVTLFRPAPGSGASHVAAGMLAPVTEVHYGEQALLELNLESAARYPAFVAELEALTGRLRVTGPAARCWSPATATTSRARTARGTSATLVST